MTTQKYPLPNLFGREKIHVAHALYAVAIPSLMWRGEVVEALRQLRLVRSFGRRRRVARRHTDWTRGFELAALIALGEGEAAWRVMLADLREFYPKLGKQPLAKRLIRMSHFIRYWEIPAAYFSGRLEHATEAMEALLEWEMKHFDAYELRNSIFNGDPRPNPRKHVRVTLFHLYSDAGRTLATWPHWRSWVERLHPGLLRLARLERADLAADASLMQTFHERLRVAERERRPAFVTFGQSDLVEPKAKVLARQLKIKRRAARDPSAYALMLASKRAEYFPWLAKK